QSNNIQNENSWLYTELDQKQYEELFYLSSDMNSEINEELTNYLSSILDELCTEKNQETNTIDELVHHQSQIEHMKKCLACQTSNIDNKKHAITLWFKLSNQYQGYDTILEEINKSLKSLIPPIPSQCEINEPHIRPSFTAKSYRFWVQIRKAQFINPNVNNCAFQNLSRELILSEEMIRFSDSDRLCFRDLSNKSREDLVNILQEIRNILTKNNINTNE
ncbi:29905_t:CDS:2, partial [Racocetra persica]